MIILLCFHMSVIKGDSVDDETRDLVRNYVEASNLRGGELDANASTADQEVARGVTPAIMNIGNRGSSALSSNDTVPLQFGRYPSGASGCRCPETLPFVYPMQSEDGS